MRLTKFTLPVLLLASLAPAAVDYSAGLTAGKADMKSAGSLAFGPDGILFAGDSIGAAIFALDTQDRAPGKAPAVDVKGLGEKVAALLGASADQILINDMAVNPISRKTYLSVSRGKGPDAVAVIVRLNAAGKLEEVALDKVRHSRVSLPDAPDANKKDARGGSPRMESITDLAYVDGKVFVAGLSNHEFSSTLRAIPFPFKDAGSGTSVEIYHGQHGRFETNSPVRTFVPYAIKAEPYLLAAYTCTPLVKVPVADLKPGTKIMGTTIAELGNRNRPLDMIVYTKAGKEFILMNNSSRGVMKMSTDNIDKYEPIKAQVERKGLNYDTIAELKGVEQLDKLDNDHALILVRNEGGAMDLKSIPLP